MTASGITEGILYADLQIQHFTSLIAKGFRLKPVEWLELEDRSAGWNEPLWKNALWFCRFWNFFELVTLQFKGLFSYAVTKYANLMNQNNIDHLILFKNNRVKTCCDHLFEKSWALFAALSKLDVDKAS